MERCRAPWWRFGTWRATVREACNAWRMWRRGRAMHRSGALPRASQLVDGNQQRPSMPISCDFSARMRSNGGDSWNSAEACPGSLNWLASDVDFSPTVRPHVIGTRLRNARTLGKFTQDAAAKALGMA